jgi:hypothetical protein
MTGVKKWAAIVVVFMMVAITQMTFAAGPDPSVYLLKQLDKDQQSVTVDLKNKIASFDKAGSTVTTGKESVSGMELDVTTYTDKNGNVLKVYKSPNGKDAMVKLISPGSVPVVTIAYNPDGTVAKEETFQPFGLKKETVIYNSDGTKTITVQDASLAANNTLTYQEDQNGNVVPGSETISTTPGLPPGYDYCQVTGQYQEAKPK